MQPATQIIIINYRNWQDTLECLESLLSLEYKDFGVLMVEMCDLNSSRLKINQWMNKHPSFRVKMLEVDDNLGFAGANNFALRFCLEKQPSVFYWLLNNDTVAGKDSLDHLVASWFELRNSNRNPAFVGSQVLEYHRREILQSVGGAVSKWSGIVKLTGLGKNSGSYQENGVMATDFVLGASMFFHHDLLEIIGLMDVGYFLYFEDVDWCITAQSAGFQNFTCLNSRIYHKQGASTGNKYDKTYFNPATFEYLHSGYLRFFKKHFPRYVPIACFMLLKQMTGKIVRGRFPEARIIAKVMINYCFMSINQQVKHSK